MAYFALGTGQIDSSSWILFLWLLINQTVHIKKPFQKKNVNAITHRITIRGLCCCFFALLYQYDGCTGSIQDGKERKLQQMAHSLTTELN